MNNPLAVLLASFIASTSTLPTQHTFSFKEPVIEREVVEEDVFAMYRHVVGEHTQNDPTVMELYNRYEKLVREEAKNNPQFSAELCLQAVTYAAEKHEGQVYSPYPYLYHLLSVSLILIEEGHVNDHYVLAAAALHDSLEDTDASQDELQYLFGQEVASIVVEVTNEPNLTYANKHEWQLEHAKTMSPRACLVKAADRTHNLRSFNKQFVTANTERAKHIRRYFTASIKLADVLSGHNEELDHALQAAIEEHFKLRPTVDLS